MTRAPVVNVFVLPSLVIGAGGIEEGDLPEFEAALRPAEIHRAQMGWFEDMGRVADELYGRAG